MTFNPLQGLGRPVFLKWGYVYPCGGEKKEYKNINFNVVDNILTNVCEHAAL